MSKKNLIFGATGAVGSSLSKLLKDHKLEAHLIGKNKDEISRLADETGFKYSVADVLEENFVEKILQDIDGADVSGIAYCVGSINFKPINLITKKDMLDCFSLNLFPVYEII